MVQICSRLSLVVQRLVTVAEVVQGCVKEVGAGLVVTEGVVVAVVGAAVLQVVAIVEREEPSIVKVVVAERLLRPTCCSVQS